MASFPWQSPPIFLIPFLLSFFVNIIDQVQAFPVGKKLALWRSSSPTTTSLRYTEDDSGDLSPPQNVTLSATVFLNPHYVPPSSSLVVPVPTKQQQTTISTTSTRQRPSSQLVLKGGDQWMDIGTSLQQIHIANNNHELLLWQEAGKAIWHLGIAWNSNDWEQVTYAAMDASLSVKTLAQSLNNNHHRHGRHHEDNEFQQAMAGIAVELWDLSNAKEPVLQTPANTRRLLSSKTTLSRVVRVPLQSLAQRFREASRSTLDDDLSRCLEQAALAAQSLSQIQ